MIEALFAGFIMSFLFFHKLVIAHSPFILVAYSALWACCILLVNILLYDFRAGGRLARHSAVEGRIL